MPDKCRDLVKSRYPLRIARQSREEISPVALNEEECAFESGAAKSSLHQCDGEDFSVAKGGFSVIGCAPVGYFGMGLEVIIDEAEQ
jgi:Cys-tRNA synthase (O-phospho-L-seryl-tRNA:Cys-tRNA synthase)